MGTIAARDALRVLELSEQVAAANLIATVQALRLRERQPARLARGPRIESFLAEIGDMVPFIEDDVPLDVVLRKLVDSIETRAFALPEGDAP